jgi:hypothetical protein
LVGEGLHLGDVSYGYGCASDFFVVLADRRLGYTQNLSYINLGHVMFFYKSLRHKRTDCRRNSFYGDFAGREQFSTDYPILVGKPI